MSKTYRIKPIEWHAGDDCHAFFLDYFLEAYPTKDGFYARISLVDSGRFINRTVVDSKIKAIIWCNEIAMERIKQVLEEV